MCKSFVALHQGWNFTGLCSTIKMQLKEKIMETKADEYMEKTMEGN